MAGRIRAGIGGWTFEPWRGVFYPPGLKHAEELNYASRRVTAIEINSTYYSTQKPHTFAKWAASVPDDFKFTVKASRFCTNRRVLAEAGESIEKFLGQGLTELGPRLGPILWEFMPTKQFAPDDFAAFLDLLPNNRDGLPLSHCVEVRHASFAARAFVAMCRKRGVAICCSENANYPLIADVTGDFVYARLLTGSDDVETAYTPEALDAWAARFKAYASGETPGDLATVADAAETRARDVYAFFIHEGKVRAPAAAMALLSRCGAGDV